MKNSAKKGPREFKVDLNAGEVEIARKFDEIWQLKASRMIENDWSSAFRDSVLRNSKLYFLLAQ